METNFEGKRVEIDLFPDLPAVLAAAPQARSPQSKPHGNTGHPGRDAAALTPYVLKYQQAMLKKQFNLTKWLRCALMPNLSDSDFVTMQEAMEASQAYLRSHLPVEAEVSSSSASSEDSRMSDSVFSPRSNRFNTQDGLSRASLGSISPRAQPGRGEDPQEALSTLLRQRSISDMLHDRLDSE